MFRRRSPTRWSATRRQRPDSTRSRVHTARRKRESTRWTTRSIDRYCRASEVNDIDALAGTRSPQVEFVSPLSARMVFRGSDDVAVLLSQVYGALRGLHWSEQFGEGSRRVVIGESRIGPFRIGDAMALQPRPRQQCKARRVARQRPASLLTRPARRLPSGISRYCRGWRSSTGTPRAPPRPTSRPARQP